MLSLQEKTFSCKCTLTYSNALLITVMASPAYIPFVNRLFKNWS